MKVIDLLNKIANGEEVPKKIRIYGRNDSIYEWQSITNTNLYHYFNIDTHARMGSDWKLDGRILNNEVEIIEEDTENKIEKIQKTFSLYFIDSKIDCKTKDEIDYIINELINKVDEIIDVVNKGVNNENN